MKAFADFTVAQFGRIDVALNNAGITLEKSLHEYSAGEWDDVLHTNLRGVFFAMKHQIPMMLAAGGGNIVVTSSSNAIATQGRRGAYAASKRALVALVQAAALEYGPHNIRVNALLPGTTDTALVRRVAGMENIPDAAWHAAAAAWAKSHLSGLGRMANPEEIAEFALAQKRAIGAEAAKRLKNRESVIFDGGTTVLEAARCAARRGLQLTAVTNGLDIAQALATAPGMIVMVPGGTVRSGFPTLVGEPGRPATPVTVPVANDIAACVPLASVRMTETRIVMLASAAARR